MNEKEFKSQIEEIKWGLEGLQRAIGFWEGKFKELKEEEKFHKIPPPNPEGFVITGEFREPKDGEHIISPLNGLPTMVIGNAFGDCAWIIERVKSAPEGFKFTGETRKPRKGEWFLGKEGQALRSVKDFFAAQYLILQKIPKLRRWIFEETGEVREANYNEYFLELGSEPCITRRTYRYPTNKVKILRLVKEDDSQT